jgi:hypothetical protein
MRVTFQPEGGGQALHRPTDPGTLVLERKKNEKGASSSGEQGWSKPDGDLPDQCERAEKAEATKASHKSTASETGNYMWVGQEAWFGGVVSHIIPTFEGALLGAKATKGPGTMRARHKKEGPWSPVTVIRPVSDSETW